MPMTTLEAQTRQLKLNAAGLVGAGHHHEASIPNKSEEKVGRAW